MTFCLDHDDDDDTHPSLFLSCSFVLSDRLRRHQFLFFFPKRKSTAVVPFPSWCFFLRMESIKNKYHHIGRRPRRGISRRSNDRLNQRHASPKSTRAGEQQTTDKQVNRHMYNLGHRKAARSGLIPERSSRDDFPTEKIAHLFCGERPVSYVWAISKRQSALNIAHGGFVQR